MTHVFPWNTLNNYFDTRFKFICDSIVISQTKSRKEKFGSITERGTNQFSQRFRLVIPAMAKSKMHIRDEGMSGWKFLTCVFYGGYRVGWAKNQLFVETNNDRAAFILAQPSRTSFSLYFRGEVSYKLSVFCGIRSCRVQSPIRFNVYSRNLWISCSMFPCLKDVYVSLDFSSTLKGKFVLVFATV